MSTIYRWSSSADGTWTATVGTAPSVVVGGTYGERWEWPSTTATAFGTRAFTALTNHGIRLVYSFAAFNTAGVSHMILMGMAGTSQWKLNVTPTGLLRILDAAGVTAGTAAAGSELAAGTEYRIECYRVGSALTAKAYTLAGTLRATVSGTVSSTAIDVLQVGNNAALSGGTMGAFTVDELVITDVGAEVGPVVPTATTYYHWEDSSDGTSFNTTVGTAPSIVSGGSYGERWVWPATTASSYGGVTLPSIGDFGCRFIYSIDAWPTTGTHSVLQGQATGGAQQFKVDISTGRVVNIRPAASTPIVAGTVALATDTEYRFEVQRSGATLTVKVYSGTGSTLIDSATHTAVGTTALTRMAFGNNSTPSAGATVGSYTFDEIFIQDQPVDVGPVTPSAPTVSAPADFTVEPWEPFTLTATSTATSCTWEQVDGTLTADPVNGTGLVATVAAAPASLSGATLVYRATVTGGDTDDVTVTVLPATDAIYTSMSADPVDGPAPIETLAWIPVRLLTTPTTPPSGLAADRAADFRSRIGFCAGAKDSPYVDEPTTSLTTMLDYISPVPGSDIGVLRIGRIVDSDTTTRTCQRTWATIAKARGIKLLGMADDYGTSTPASRLTEALTNWQGQLLAILNRNEPQRYWTLAEWPDAGLEAADSTAEMVSKEQLLAEFLALKTARDASSKPGLPIASSGMASKSVYTWYQALQTYALSIGKSVSTLTQWIELHDYPGGWEPSNANGTRKTREAAEAAFGVNRTTLLTETGYHNGGTDGVPEAVAATYYPRLWFENLYDNGYEYVLAFQLCNIPGQQYGIFYDDSIVGHAKYDPKPAATTVRNLLTLYADTATSYTPQPLPGGVVSAPTGVSWKLHQRSDGKWLLAIWQPAGRVWNPGTQTAVTPTTKTFTLSLPTARTIARHIPRLSSTAQTTVTSTAATVTVDADLTVLLIT